MVEVVTTRDPEWDDYEREKLQALAEYEVGVHVNGCGVHESLAHDKRNKFQLDVRVCPLCQSLAAQERELAELDEKAEKAAKGDPSAPRPSDGRSVFLRMVADPSRSPGEEARPSHDPRSP